MKIIITNQQKINLIKILIYGSYLLDKEGYDHEKVLYKCLDKKQRSYRSDDIESLDQLIYHINPFNGSYEIKYNSFIIKINFEVLNKEQLYPYQEKDVFDHVYKLELENENKDTIENFIKDALIYTQKFFEIDNFSKLIYIFHYNEIDASWEKYNEVPRRNIDTIYLPSDQSQKILNDVQKFLSKETKSNYEKFGIPYHKTYCLYGPPGTGKTSLIHSICSTIQKHICIYRFSSQTKDYDFAQSLKWIPKNSVFVLEDIDCIIQNRKEGHLSFSGLLNILDGISTIDCMLIFITTNHFIQLDQAIKRPGRIDYILEFTFINKEQIYKMLNIFYPDESSDFDIVYNKLKSYKMTVSHLQKFLFSIYPQGNILHNLPFFIDDFLKYYIIDDLKFYI